MRAVLLRLDIASGYGPAYIVHAISSFIFCIQCSFGLALFLFLRIGGVDYRLKLLSALYKPTAHVYQLAVYHAPLFLIVIVSYIV